VKIDFTLDGCDKLVSKLQSLNKIRFEAVVKKNAVQLFNYMKNGNTPVKTGEMRQSLLLKDDLVAYTKEYAPHVEYGHRTKNGGWINGQHFLQKGVEHQKPIYKQDLKNAIKKEGA